ncbi:HipA domain-containing protein [Hydrogenophaga palleronii]|uniref:HipA domain-containing protein n=1 Tax=Hydrogenophaga palleronii TaxID=65655 RepID=UPI000825BE8B|nr:HipA domain-containing protein [Hydrogenophaga palleronii]
MRTPQYASLRSLPGGLAARQKIHRILSTGSVVPFAVVEFIEGGGTLERIGGQAQLYDGLPPYMAFSSPSGFLGRQLARAVATDLQLPESLKDWGDDERIAYLFSRGMNLAGNLVYGDLPLQKELDFRGCVPMPAGQKLGHYVDVATELKGTAYGSSAGGEQPKFLGFNEDTGHVIVKFAKRGSRMAELLPLEHLALHILSETGVPSARTAILSSKDYVFLEVQRFDRVGNFGRVGMLSAGSVDDEFFGRRDTWSEFAARCEKAKYISARDAWNIDVMAAFSELIGNGDRHLENISLLVDDEGEYQSVAPAYDILPMDYASIGGGIDPDLNPIKPKVGTIGARPDIWAPAAAAASAFWSTVRDNHLALPATQEMRDLAARNVEVVKAFVAPLVPS